MANKISGVINNSPNLTENLQSLCLDGEISPGASLVGNMMARGPKGEKGDPGTTVYSELTDKPSIEGVTLEGDTSFEDLGLVIDETLSTSSENLITNKAVSQAIETINNNMPVVETKTTEEWNNSLGYVPAAGAIIIYSDYSERTETIGDETHTIKIPNFKVGDGLAFVQDLPFVSEEIRVELENHLRDASIHVTLADKLFWNNKINITDSQEVMDEILIINRS